MKGEAGMVTGVPPPLPELRTRTAFGVLNAASSVYVAGEAILSKDDQRDGEHGETHAWIQVTTGTGRCSMSSAVSQVHRTNMYVNIFNKKLMFHVIQAV